MRNFFIFITFLLFLLNKDSVVLGATSALNIWSKNVFPVLFPTFIIADLIISSSFITIFTKYFGSILSKIFKTTKYVAFVLIISLLCGTPTNAKILKNLYENNLIREESITKILTFTYFFNPFFILIFTNVRVLIIFWISNLITGILLRNKYIDDYANTENYNISFNLGESIAKNMNIIINILGTITVFMVISYTIPFINPLFNVIVTSILELTTSLYKIKTYFNINYFYLASLSFGGISILIQIKSIMKDTFIDYKLLIKSRIITLIISLAICWLTQGIAT